MTAALGTVMALGSSATARAGGPVIIDYGDQAGRETVPVDYADRAIGEGAEPRTAAPSAVVWQGYVATPVSRPVFYGDGQYWMYDGAHWYRSPYYDHGFTYVRESAVPWGVRSGDEPGSYHDSPAYPTYPLSTAYPTYPAVFPGDRLAPPASPSMFDRGR